MGGQWKEVARLTFKGRRFDDHALDLNAIAELGQFQKIVAETAKALWRAANPERRRLPRHFEERTRLCLRRIENGSAVAPLEVRVEEPGQLTLGFVEPEPGEVVDAIDLVRRVVRSVERDGPLPEDLPKALLSEYQRWGQGLSDDDVIEVSAAGKEPARVTPLSRARLAAFCETTHETTVDVTGEVLEADVRQGRFQVWVDDKTRVTVTFTPEQEDKVTAALRDHRSLRLQVIGKGEFSPEGKPTQITHVERLRARPVGEVRYDASARPIEDVLAQLAREIPEEDWTSLPSDLTDNLDHHVYGTPRR